MLRSSAVSSATIYAVLPLCTLCVGFMIKFLIALATDGKKLRVDCPVRLKGVRYWDDVSCEEPRSSHGAVNPAAHALGRNPTTKARAQPLTGSISPRY
jgi:hypothetical protein